MKLQEFIAALGGMAKLVRRTVGLTVCYVLVLQAFLAAFGTALAVGQRTGADAGLAICPNVEGHAPADDSTKGPASAPCALCAIAAAAGGLPAEPLSDVLAPPAVAARVGHADSLVVARAAPVRAGLARAPPEFA